MWTPPRLPLSGRASVQSFDRLEENQVNRTALISYRILTELSVPCGSWGNAISVSSAIAAKRTQQMLIARLTGVPSSPASLERQE